MPLSRNLEYEVVMDELLGAIKWLAFGAAMPRQCLLHPPLFNKSASQDAITFGNTP
jgi:hypothetical protein